MMKGDAATMTTTRTKDRPRKDDRDNTNDMYHHVTNINDCHHCCQQLLSTTTMMIAHTAWWKWGSRMTSRQRTGQHKMVKVVGIALPSQLLVHISHLFPHLHTCWLLPAGAPATMTKGGNHSDNNNMPHITCIIHCHSHHPSHCTSSCHPHHLPSAIIHHHNVTSCLVDHHANNCKSHTHLAPVNSLNGLNEGTIINMKMLFTWVSLVLSN